MGQANWTDTEFGTRDREAGNRFSATYRIFPLMRIGQHRSIFNIRPNRDAAQRVRPTLELGGEI